MTRKELIHHTRTDWRQELIRCSVLFVMIGLFGCLMIQLGDYWAWHGGPNNPKSLELWLVIGLKIGWAILVAKILMAMSKRQIKCPHCKKPLIGFARQVVIGSGRCGFCGEQVIDEQIEQSSSKSKKD